MGCMLLAALIVKIAREAVSNRMTRVGQGSTIMIESI